MMPPRLFRGRLPLVKGSRLPLIKLNPHLSQSSRVRHLSTSTPSRPPWRPSVALDEWAQRDARPISLRQLTFFGRTLTEERLLSSANYVREELPTRIAHRLRDMQTLPYVVVTNPHLSYVYELYWRAFDSFKATPPIKTLEDNDRFCQLLKQTLEEHLTAIPRLVTGILEVQGLLKPEATDGFVMAMLKSRISRRVIAEQHLALTDTFNSLWHDPNATENNDPNSDFIGEIFLKCNAEEVVRNCANAMRARIQEDCGSDVKIPEVKVFGHLSATFPYIQSHLEYIIGELLRNSMQAVMDKHHSGDAALPPIEVLICEASQHVIFRVSDQGGGIPRDVLSHLWSFSKGPRRDLKIENLQKVPKMAATMQEVRADEASPPAVDSPVRRTSSLGTLTSRPPNLRLGIGLPMSKIYAEYWAGSIAVHSLEGYGTDAFLQIPKLGNKNEQLTTRASIDSI